MEAVKSKSEQDWQDICTRLAVQLLYYARAVREVLVTSDSATASPPPTPDYRDTDTHSSNWFSRERNLLSLQCSSAGRLHYIFVCLFSESDIIARQISAITELIVNPTVLWKRIFPKDFFTSLRKSYQVVSLCILPRGLLVPIASGLTQRQFWLHGPKNLFPLRHFNCRHFKN